MGSGSENHEDWEPSCALDFEGFLGVRVEALVAVCFSSFISNPMLLPAHLLEGRCYQEVGQIEKERTRTRTGEGMTGSQCFGWQEALMVHLLRARCFRLQ